MTWNNVICFCWEIWDMSNCQIIKLISLVFEIVCKTIEIQHQENVYFSATIKNKETYDFDFFVTKQWYFTEHYQQSRKLCCLVSCGNSCAQYGHDGH